ncbi:SNF2 helicase associated domain-containing protein [Paenibacillus sp. LHD-38]|uniref:DEAD/DEAH box helicase n=1 Tax=Paenibacillus sp. LHD-38 TaxID=3072143 RepID=UPI00281021FF|nr:SNF2 helicase associated domain-containing protein [Paenibacillus sp. LHD-38]MDQ8734358.1 SNF2 helicase associated domain-containing protein [Paenibacillus sp. LHD-38]
MSTHLSRRIIKLLCGDSFYERGEAFNRDGNVTLTSSTPQAGSYSAIIHGNKRYEVTIEVDRNGDVEAACTCLAFSSYDKYCMHVAAALLQILDAQEQGDKPARVYPSLLHPEDRPYEDDEDAEESDSLQLQPRFANSAGLEAADTRLAASMLGLFGGRPARSSGRSSLFDTRTPLEVEISCKLHPYGYRKYMFGIELRIGPKRLYIVQRIREFLEKAERREPYVFSKHFTYDPSIHSFQLETDAVIRQLYQIYRHEMLFRQSSNRFYQAETPAGGERLLLIPPFSWGELLPLLMAAPTVQLHIGNQNFHGITVSDEAIPLHFAFDQAAGEGFQLEIQGLEQMTLMEEYELVITEGKLLQLKPDSCKRLAELKQLMDTSRKPKIQIAPEQMEPFMERVIPGLMKLGSVRIAETISDRVLHTQLKAKLYLDRIRDRLVAGLEFQYGDIIINPLEGSDKSRGTDRILMRDGEQERQILELMELVPFAKTEAGYFLDDEDTEFEFLHNVIPLLEKLLTVYATSAVKVRIVTKHAPPTVTVNVDERTDWLEFKFAMDGIPESEIRNLLKSLEVKRKYHRLPDGSLLPLEGAEFQEIIRFLNDVGLRKGDIQGAEFRVPAVRGLHLIDSSENSKAIKLGKSFRRLLENMRNPDNLEFSLPGSLAPVLRDYQIYGYQWMKTLAHYHFGGILADDMGLGKTVQAIAFIVSVLPEIRKRDQPALIVSPASLVYNWLNEIKKFAPEIRAVIADGTKAERSGVLAGGLEADVIITSYPLLRRDITQYAKQSFHTLIMDEAQYFKNHTTQTAQAVKSLEAGYRFALTGTPVENKLEELWSIFGAVFPELFPSRQAFNELTRETVAKRVRPFLLRRLKSDVLQELPEKIESIQASELLPEQKQLYVGFLAKLQQETVKHLNEESFHQNRIRILAGITRLRQLCCHPVLFVEDYKGSSAKFEQLLEIIEECQSAGKRLLIFSQFTEMLGLIGRELGYRGISYFYLDGQTKASERVELCNRFNDGERELFLLSLKAGGTGLNLTGADTVILYDLWWNPAVEQQAADRAHRIGQKNVVQVIRLVTQGTVEDKMYELQQKKKNLIDEVIQPGQEELSSLSEQDIREILMIQ